MPAANHETFIAEADRWLAGATTGDDVTDPNAAIVACAWYLRAIATKPDAVDRITGTVAKIGEAALEMQKAETERQKQAIQHPVPQKVKRTPHPARTAPTEPPVVITDETDDECGPE